jgi:C1A family cysteine protease
MKKEVNTMRGRIFVRMPSIIFLIIGISLFSTLLTGDSGPQVYRAPESLPLPPPSVPSMTLEEIRAMIAQEGYTYTVGETWISQLSPEEIAQLLGYRPPSVDLSHLSASGSGPQPRQLPGSYDYRDLGAVTPPKSQGACGSCWCFAAVGEKESKIILEGGAAYDLAEEEVLSCNFFGAGCDGGDDFVVANYLTKYGAALESCAPYDAHDGTPCRDCDIVWKLCGWEIIGVDLDSENPALIEIVKQALLDYGPLFVSMDASAPGFSSYTGGVFEYWGSSTVNHAVLLIGWDDTLEHSHGTGAWIVKNSWGASWGEGGFFKIAYGAAKFCDYVSAYSCAREYDDRETLYYHDDGGWQGSFLVNPYDSWGAVRFVPTADGILERVEFWAVDDALNYEIYVYDTVSGSGTYTFSGLLSSQSGSASKAGYDSVELLTKPQISAGDDFIVAIRFNTPSFQFPVPYDDNTPIAGESYYSADGSTWWNVVEEGDNLDVGIRAVLQAPDMTFSAYPGFFDTNSYFVVGDGAYCTDVLGVGKISYGLGAGGVTENPEGRTDVILTQTEHDTGNLISVGGPAVNPIATEFGTIFGITYDYTPGVEFEIFCEGESIYLNLTQYPAQDICIVYLGSESWRTVMLVWGYGWEGTYAGSVLMGDPLTWQTYADCHLLLLRWIDSNADGLVQMSEITVEVYT